MTAMDENALVERVFLRIGSADTDEQLEVALGKFLTPILLKLNSSEDGIRTKVMELLVHINKRLKSRNKVQLPVEALLTQFQDPTATPFVTNFTILYIKMGYPRLEQVKQAELLPMLINCLEGRPVNQQNSLLLLMIPALQYLKFPSSAEKRQSMFQLRDKPQISKLLLDYMMDILLLPYSAHALASSTASGPVTVPPGLSEYGLKRVLGENPMNPESLEKAKLGILTFLGADILAESDIVCHYIIASSDTRHSVATSADMELKRIMGSIDWNSTEILNKLYRIFQGTVVIKGQTAVKPEQRRVPVCTRIRLKIFPFFLKSKEAVSMFPSCIQVVFDCLFGANLNAKLRIMAVQFVHHICYNCDATKFKMFDAVLLSGMVKLIGEAKEDNKLRSLAYVAVGKIARRSPERVAKDITLIQQFFESVCQEDVETRLAVQEALSLMSDAFRQLDPTNLKLMEALIMQYMDKTEPQARSVAVQYAVAVFPSNHIPSRYILLLASGDTKDDIRGEAMKALTPTSDTTTTTATTKSSLPDFVQMTQYIKEKASQRKESHQRYTTGNTVLPFNPTAYTQMLIYLRMCLYFIRC
ncbi:proteasome adapter and scaffold protein ECM29 [Patella vulgata]|uniref:proteasome adapter and scaffold protein ECM29 n=1 Tax=Patella vulgata TaxID=6465 RepID=UPI0024A991A7|nr:proteasome adapter and scaffold protein ECM29 [Patella vulgata]